MAIIPVMWDRLLHEFDDDDDLWTWPAGGQPYMRVWPARGLGLRQKPMEKRKWTHVVNIGNFDPDHVKVKVENGKVLIHAKYNDGNEEWGDTVERKRSVQIPDGVDVEKIRCSIRSDGKMVLEAPYVEIKDKAMKVETSEDRSLVPSDKENSLMELDVSNYKPEEVTITCKDGVITAQGKRERSEDGHEIRESFFRQMTLPKSVDQKNLKCIKGDDGKLSVCINKEKDVEME